MAMLGKTWPTSCVVGNINFVQRKAEGTTVDGTLWQFTKDKQKLSDRLTHYSSNAVFLAMQPGVNSEGMWREFEAEKRINLLEKQLNQLACKIDSLMPQEKCLRDIGHVQAKAEIEAFFKEHHGEKINPGDIEEALEIEIALAIDICDELEREGKIKTI